MRVIKASESLPNAGHLDVGPQSMSMCSPSRTDSTASLVSADVKQALFGQKYLSSSRRNFIFRLVTPNHSQSLYGVCVYTDELVSLLPAFIEIIKHKRTHADGSGMKELLQRCHLSSHISAAARTAGEADDVMRIASPDTDTSGAKAGVTVAPRAYCLLSRYPFFKLHFDVLYRIIGHESLIRMTLEQALSANGDIEELSVRHCIELCSEVEALLVSFHGTVVPAPGDVLTLDMPMGHKQLSFFCPGGDNWNHELLSRWCLPVIASIISLSNLLALYNALLVERHLVILSRNPGLVSVVVLGLVTLLDPLTWQGLLIPLLPLQMKETLHAPVPYIIGSLGLPKSLINEVLDGGAVIYHIETDSIQSSKASPPLPESSKLRNNSMRWHSKLFDRSRADDNPVHIPDERVSIARNLASTFRHYAQWLLTRISVYFKDIPRASYEQRDAAKRRVIASVELRNRRFVSELVETQHFTHHVDVANSS